MTRIYHTWEKWECYPAGLYETGVSDMTATEAQELYAKILCDSKRFEKALRRVIAEWPKSCEHYLTNEAMNRIAWLGQASACVDSKLPRCYRGGFNLLSEKEQDTANKLALRYLNVWLKAHNEELTDLEGAGISSKVDLY